jgi:hypothetical protein
MRFSAKPQPLMAPWVFTASRAYSEQVGVKRQDGPSIGLMAN